MGLVSGWSLPSHSNSESFLVAHASLSQDAGDYPDPRIEPVSPISSALQADSLHIENISFKNEDGEASLENILTVLPKEKWKSIHTHTKTQTF